MLNFLASTPCQRAYTDIYIVPRDEFEKLKCFEGWFREDDGCLENTCLDVAVADENNIRFPLDQC